MAIKNTGRVTVTLRRTTVKKLRNTKKKGEKWDDFLLDLARYRGQGTRIICMVCGKMLETENIYESSSILAKKNRWAEVAVKGRQQSAIGFACLDCLLKFDAKEIEKESALLNPIRKTG